VARKIRCIECKQYEDKEKMTRHPVGNFCSFDCIKIYISKKIERQKKAQRNKQKREQAAQKKISKFKVKSYAKKMKELQKAFNEMRRYEEFLWFAERKMKPTCISCGGELGGDQWSCGHYKTVGARPDLRFDRKNTYLQHNNRCNMHLSGDIENYKRGLTLRFGESEAADILSYLEVIQDTEKMTDCQIQSKMKEYRGITKNIKNKLNK